MSYELVHNTTRRAPKLSSPAVSKAYRKPPKEDERMSDKTATERLRELLDERGVEWWNDTDPEPQRQTNVWAGVQLVMFHENANGTVGYVVYSTHDLTPEQAIAATLGNDGPERSNDGVDVTCVPDDYTAKLMAEVKRLQAENAKLRELVKDMWHDGMCECDERWACAECEYHFPESMRELGIEVDA